MFDIQYKEPVSGYPTLLLISGQPGVGKSTLINGLNQNGYKALHIDLQGGTAHVGGYVLDINAIAIKNGISFTNAFMRTLEFLRQENVKNNEPIYDFVVFDPLIKFKEIIHTYGTHLYNSSVQGKSSAKKQAELLYGPQYTKEHLLACMCKDVVADLGQNGWSWLNNAWTEIFNKITGLAGKTTIIVAHTKYNTLKKSSIEELDVKQIDFYPSYLLSLIGESSDSGVIYRKDNEVHINFEFKDNHDHFKSRNFEGEDIVLSRKEGSKIVVDWSPVFPFITTPKGGGEGNNTEEPKAKKSK